MEICKCALLKLPFASFMYFQWFTRSHIRLGQDATPNLQCQNKNCTRLATDKKIGGVIVHEAYNDTTRENDIALIRFEEPLSEFTSEIEPICLRWVHKPGARETSSNEKFSVIGCRPNSNGKENVFLAKFVPTQHFSIF